MSSKLHWSQKEHPYVQVGLLCLMLLSFFAKNLTEIAWLAPFLAPDYTACQKAISKLKRANNLHYTDEGCDVLSGIFVEWYRENRRSEIQGELPDDVRIDTITITGGFGAGGFISNPILRVEMVSPGTQINGATNCDVETLSEIANGFKEAKTLQWSGTLFVISFLGEVYFVFQKFRKNENTESALAET